MKHEPAIAVVGTPAGGVKALEQLVASLPGDLNTAVFIVLRLSPSMPSELAAILQRCTTLPVAEAIDGAMVRGGTVTVARPDYHLVFDCERVRLMRSPTENRHRPAVDALFRSAAFAFAGRVIGVVLTGVLNDGTAGLWTIRDRGGLAIVQEPAGAAFRSMPESALKHAAPTTSCLWSRSEH